MLKVLYFTSEIEKKFGVYKVVDLLKKKLKKKISIKLSSNIFDIFLFKRQIIHIHGCWKPRLFFAFLFAKLSSRKIIISPHGMIDPFSFSQKKIKKEIAWFIYQKFMFIFSNLVIVNSKLEQKNLENKLKIKKKIKIIYHGIDVPKNLKNYKKINNELSFVFFSRIHPSKNLLKLINLWRNDFFYKKYTLDIYGEVVHKEYFNEVNKKILKEKNINYKGKIGSGLIKKLSNYDIFIHPSKSENFGLVILEALSCGLCPIVNKKLDWKVLDQKNLGYSINFSHKSLKKTIKKLIKKKRLIRGKIFQKKVKTFLKEKYNWDKIVIDYQNEYNSLINFK